MKIACTIVKLCSFSLQLKMLFSSSSVCFCAFSPLLLDKCGNFSFSYQILNNNNKDLFFFSIFHPSQSQHFTDPWLTTNLQGGSKAEEKLQSTVLWDTTWSTLLSRRYLKQSKKSAKQSALSSTWGKGGRFCVKRN